jgi:hypothetical protein
MVDQKYLGTRQRYLCHRGEQERQVHRIWTKDAYGFPSK